MSMRVSQPLIFMSDLVRLSWKFTGLLTLVKNNVFRDEKKLFNFYVETGLTGCQLTNTKLSDTFILVFILARLATNMQQGARKNTLLRQQSRMTCSDSGKCWGKLDFDIIIFKSKKFTCSRETAGCKLQDMMSIKTMEIIKSHEHFSFFRYLHLLDCWNIFSLKYCTSLQLWKAVPEAFSVVLRDKSASLGEKKSGATREVKLRRRQEATAAGSS